MPLAAGVATVEITPPVGAWLAGFAGRNKPSQGVHDPLHSKALVLDDGATRLCIVTNDLLALATETCGRIRDLVAAETKISAGNVLINCSHTHSGPSAGDGDYGELLVRRIVGAVRMAEAHLAPARVGHARGAVQVGINRRELRDGRIILGRDPEKPVAPYVDVLRVDDADGAPFAVLFAHAAHAVTRAADNYLISADYPGQAQAVVEGVYPRATAMFAQGCAGNINADPCGGSFEDVRRLGTMLAGEVIRTRECAPTTDEVRLIVAHRPFRLPTMLPADIEPVRAQLAALGPPAADDSQPASGAERYRRREIEYLRGLVEAYDKQLPPPPVEFSLQAVAIGDLALIGLPGEVFVEYALHAESVSAFARTICLGYTNGSTCYVPTAAAIAEGGYEPAEAPRYFGHFPLAPEAEGALNEAVEGLLGELRAEADAS